MTISKFHFSTLKLRRSRIFINSAAIALAGLTILANHAQAQPTCPPPQPGEYLLLIVTQTGEQQDKAKRSLPQNANNITICRYISDTVTRVGGFSNPQAVNEWARYFQERIGLPAYAIQQPGVVPTPQSPPPNNPVSINPGFKPQPLGVGYAVLVDYVNQPQLAAQVQQALGRELALVSYGQRSYLLATYTTDGNAATSTLQTLSDRGFLAMLVDSRRVTLISPTVK
ncbi:hypothetical protein PN499_07595 [Kamptonema animale CS-326]|jgi:hypothetical protein|uniref:hypothetical protein n=1 Tax=Kamptonema animale TaxID=92934 RepID=UPI00232C8D12|nr:hypothetical protein [Kamptonema animale]MDB9511042.1 hypothetical protein [Kamptonema animale CS-326]